MLKVKKLKLKKNIILQNKNNKQREKIMGVFKYAPKHYNPNWGINSARRKRWEQAEKTKTKVTYNNKNDKKNGTNNKK